MEDLFSINKAAHILERDRATLVRTLRYMQPDGYRSGRLRWTLASITLRWP
jgi:hypothetical protein